LKACLKSARNRGVPFHEKTISIYLKNHANDYPKGGEINRGGPGWRAAKYGKPEGEPQGERPALGKKGS